MSLLSRLVPPLSGLALLGLASPAAALSPEACGEEACPRGYACELVPRPCPAIDCIEGEECEPCDSSSEPECVPLPCEDDADCDPAMRCIVGEQRECTGGTPPCAVPSDGGDPDCPEPSPEECTTTRVSQCVPRWALGCEVASDCGAGFTCEEQQQCGCSGSAGSAGGDPLPTPDVPSDSGEDPAAPSSEPGDAGAPDCVCEPTGEYVCARVEQACASAADCPSGWTCGDNPEGVCWSGPEGSGCSADPEFVCLPPFWGLGGVRGGVGEDGSTSSPGPSGPLTGNDNGASDGDRADGAEDEEDGGGCAIAHPGSPSQGARHWGLGLALVGLFALLRRRRAAER